MTSPKATTKDKHADKPDNSGRPVALNPRQRSFVAEYLKDKNATHAYMRAYGSTKETAMRAGPRLMEHVGVKAEIDRHLSEIVEVAKHQAGITLERVLTELARIAFFDPRKLFDKEGNPVAVHQLDDDTAAVIAGLDVLEQYESDGAGGKQLVGHVKKWKLATKDGALDKLMKHLGGYAKDNAQKPPAEAPAVVDPREVASRLAFILARGVQAANDSSKPAAAA